MPLQHFFKTTTLSSGEGESRQNIEVSQWVAAGSVLAAIDSDETGEQDSRREEYVLIPGEGVELSANKRALLAVAAGYPRLSTRLEGSVRVVTITCEPMIILDEDGWSAKLTLHPPFAGAPLPSQHQIGDELERLGVRWGIREQTISALRNKVETERTPAIGVTVARGRMPVNGQDSKLRLEVTVGVLAGEEQADGSMNFRERNIFIGVESGQLLATKVPATSGLAGITVFGNDVPQIPGKDLPIKSTPDVLYDERTGQVRAAFAGVLSVVNDTTVKVSNKQVIPENVDYGTGNVRSKGAVEIGGSIRPGFSLKAAADAVINGMVESGRIEGGANVVVRGGVIGKQSLIEAEGDVQLAYIEEGCVRCHGSVAIQKEAYFADIRSLGSIVCGSESKIVGCLLLAGGSIQLAQGDTSTSPNSVLAAAVDYNKYDRYEQLRAKVADIEEALTRLRLRLGPDATSFDIKDMEADLNDYQDELQALKLIPVSADDATGGLRYACGQRITIGGVLQAGALIRIGNVEAVSKHTCREGYFALNSETLRIMFYSSSNPLKNLIL